MNNPTTPDELLDYWPGNIPFKGALVSKDGTCMCAQGQALHFLDGVTPAELRNYDQHKADERVAKLFGISRAHAVLLRIVNDKHPGAPSVVIRDPAKVLGDQAETVLAFWWHLDSMTAAEWAKTAAETAAKTAAKARTVAWTVAWTAAKTAEGARTVAWTAAETAAETAAGTAAKIAAKTWTVAWTAAGATNEIQGAAVLRANNTPFYFLPLFGFNQPEDLLSTQTKRA